MYCVNMQANRHRWVSWRMHCRPEKHLHAITWSVRCTYKLCLKNGCFCDIFIRFHPIF